jgi:hypothetical protein
MARNAAATTAMPLLIAAITVGALCGLDNGERAAVQCV